MFSLSSKLSNIEAINLGLPTLGKPFERSRSPDQSGRHDKCGKIFFVCKSKNQDFYIVVVHDGYFYERQMNGVLGAGSGMVV